MARHVVEQSSAGDASTINAEALRRRLEVAQETLTDERAGHERALKEYQVEVDALKERRQGLKEELWALETEVRSLRTRNATQAQQIIELRRAVTYNKYLSETSLTHTIAADAVAVDHESPPLGGGANGEVRAATWCGVEVVVKQRFAAPESAPQAEAIELSAEEEDWVKARARREADLLSRVRSPYVVTFYGVVYDERDRPCQIVVERLVAVTHEVAARDAALLCSNVAQALVYLHARGMIHGNVKLSNVLYDEERRLYKLSDLGEAQLLHASDTLMYTVRGSPAYMAPEVFDEEAMLSSAIDIFAFAVTVVEVFTGNPPTPTSMLRRGVVVPEVERRAGDLARLAEGATKTMVIRCLASPPAERPSARDCAAHFEDGVE